MDNPTVRARFRPYLDAPEKLAVTKQHTRAFLQAGSGDIGIPFWNSVLIDREDRRAIQEKMYLPSISDTRESICNGSRTSPSKTGKTLRW